MNPQIQSMLQQAIQAFQSGNFDRADSILKRVLQVDTKNLPALHVLGLIKASQSNFREAIDYLTKAARIHPNDASIQYNLAKALSDSGNDKDALTHHKKAVALAPNNPEAWLNYGKNASNLGCYDDALVFYEEALRLKPDYIEAYLNKGATLKELERFEEAIVFAEKALAINPNLTEAWLNKGLILHELKRYDEAAACYNKALVLRPDSHEAWVNNGVTLYALKRYDEAIAHYDKALSLNPEYAEAWSNKGSAQKELKQYDEANACYNKALVLMPDSHEAWVSNGAILHELKRYDEAIAHYDKALSLRPDCAKAWLNKALALHELGWYDEAIAHYDKALSLRSDYAEAWSNKGGTLNKLKRHPESAKCYQKAQELNIEDSYLLGQSHHQMMLVCDWTDYKKIINEIFNLVTESRMGAEPFGFLGIASSEKLIKNCAEIYSKDKFPSLNGLSEFSQHKHNRIRIGYLCGEFRSQATSVLMTRVWELHDKSRFDIFAFDNGWDDRSDYRQRIEAAFSNIFDISKLSDWDAAKLIRDSGIDILVNLNGFFGLGRQGIFSYKPAPIQVNYLGFPGTIGVKYLDYIIADKVVIPEESKIHYVEKVVYLPNSYQANDDQRKIANKLFSREQLCLPENAFVFSCFNNNYKITPNTFDSWMRILNLVSGSVLWLLADNPVAKNNLINEANARGIDVSRLVFAERMPLSDHLARHRQADLFLDTFPYNAHTTASDALWAGLPVLTLIGQSFAGRVAASLLNAIGLPELITSTQEEYEALAIELATNPQKLLVIKQQLANTRLSAPLFDTPLFTKNLEDAYIKMVEESQNS